MKHIWLIRTLIILVIISSAILSIEQHKKFEVDGWRVSMRSDKAGYSVYLPATFYYHWDAAAFPDSIEHNVGKGFGLNRDSGIVKTKYPYGVGLFQMPFFLIADLWIRAGGKNPTGFEPTMRRAYHLSGTLYGLAGLLLLGAFIRNRKGLWASLITISALFFGTALFYYMFFDASMSHSYSFFAFSLLLIFAYRLIESPDKKKWIGLTIALGLIGILRPVNLVIILPLAAWFLSQPKDRNWISKNFLWAGSVSACLLFLFALPQLLYYRYAFGVYLADTYPNETFNFAGPRILYQLFSPENGLLLYTPLILLFWILLIRRGWFDKSIPPVDRSLMKSIAWFTPLLVYLFASWWAPHYGCSFSSRPYTEFIPFFALGFSSISWQSFRKRQKWILPMLLVTITLCTLTTHLMLNWKGCWFYGVWDYSTWLEWAFR